jgi:hypothetical protein
MLLNSAAHIEETALNMCSTQADNSSRKLRLRCGCQFPRCAIVLTVNSNNFLTQHLQVSVCNGPQIVIRNMGTKVLHIFV